MMNIFEGDVIYGAQYVQVGEARFLNANELSMLNISKPAEIFQGKYGLSCKMFVKGSTIAHFCKSLDTRSTLVEGQMFDIRKCLVTLWKKEDSNEIKKKILVDFDALV